MQVDIPDQVINALRDALTPVIERLIDEKVEQKRPLLLSVSQVSEELSCSRASVYSLIRGGHLAAIQVGRTYKVPTDILIRYVQELAKPRYQREVISATSPGAASRQVTKTRSRRGSSSTMPEPTLVAATKPPRQPRPKKEPRVSKAQLAEQRWTLAQLAERWWGVESASELIRRSGAVLIAEGSEEATFRYGDLLDWADQHQDEFEKWLQDFDPDIQRWR
jgi:excisionase family DNA binding protein